MEYVHSAIRTISDLGKLAVRGDRVHNVQGVPSWGYLRSQVFVFPRPRMRPFEIPPFTRLFDSVLGLCGNVALKLLLYGSFIPQSENILVISAVRCLGVARGKSVNSAGLDIGFNSSLYKRRFRMRMGFGCLSDMPGCYVVWFLARGSVTFCRQLYNYGE